MQDQILSFVKMEEEATSLVVIVLVVALVVPLLILLSSLQKKKKKKLPPGPRGLPLIGNLHVLGKSPHVSLYELSRVHGPLMWLKLGRQAVIVASTPAAARHILQANDLAFSARPRLLVPTHLHNCDDIFFSSPADPHWRFLRQLCSTHLFSKKCLDAFRPLRTEEVRALVKSILASVGAPMNMRTELHKLASNIICRMVLGKRLSGAEAAGESSVQRNIIDLTVEMNNLLGVFNFGDYFPMMAWLDIQGYGKQTRALVHKFEPILQGIIEERRGEHDAGTRPNDGPQDFLALLLQASDSHGDAPILTDHHVKAALINMFGGGIDTSSITTEWAFGELLANPTKMKTLQEELENVVGTDRLVEESDIPRLPYLQAVVKEAMRLHPVVPILPPHLTTQACEVLGYDIPPNTIAHVNVWAVGRDPNTWKNPLEFLPERFLGKSIDVNGMFFELLPFGSGRRGCPGWALGLVTVHMVLASLIQGFHWTLARDLNISENVNQSLVSTMASPLILRATPKLGRVVF